MKHLPADSATVAAFWRVRFALANVLAFRKTLCGGIGGRQRFQTFSVIKSYAADVYNLKLISNAGNIIASYAADHATYPELKMEV